MELAAARQFAGVTKVRKYRVHPLRRAGRYHFAGQNGETKKTQLKKL